MTEWIDPKQVGLTSRDRIEKISDTQWALVIDRKSRIIMADGRKVLDKIRKIESTNPKVRVGLKTSTPMCSKTRQYLTDHNVPISE